MTLRFGSVCSGIEAASQAWGPLGFRASFLSEIADFPRAVLKHHYPEVPLHGDFTTIERGTYADIDVLVGGTPCQSFSIAGLRGGLGDARGNLALEYLRLAERLKPRWLVWENVPGVLSSSSHDAPDPCQPPDDMAEGSEWVGEDEYDADESHAFSCFLAGLSEIGYGWAYRSLDAQYAGLAQRRERVFVVGYFGDWRRAAAVLFEPASLRWHPAPSRESRERFAPTISGRTQGGGGLGKDFDLDGGLIADAIAPPITSNPYGDHESREGLLVAAYGGNNTAGPVDVATACNAHGGPHGRLDFESETFVAHTLSASRGTACAHAADLETYIPVAHALRADGFDASEDGTGRGAPIVPVAYRTSPNCGAWETGDRTDALTTGTDPTSHVIAFDTSQITSKTNRSNPQPNDLCHTLARGADAPAIAFSCKDHGVGKSNERASYGTQERTGPSETLRALRRSVGEEAFSEWCVGILAAFWPQEVLQSGVHGCCVRSETWRGRGLVSIASPREATCSGGAVLRLWESACAGCPPQGWQPSEQLAQKLSSYLSKLPQSPSPAERFLHDLRIADEGPGILREALSEIQKTRQSACAERKSIQPGMAVRRLIVEECEALQGFDRGYTNIQYHGKPAADGPRYKALGNSMAVPCMAWIGKRLLAEDARG